MSAFSVAYEQALLSGMSEDSAKAEADHVARVYELAKTEEREQPEAPHTHRYRKRPNQFSGAWKAPANWVEVLHEVRTWACTRRHVDYTEFYDRNHESAKVRYLAWAVLIRIVPRAVLAREFGITVQAIFYGLRKVSEIDNLAARRLADSLTNETKGNR